MHVWAAGCVPFDGLRCFYCLHYLKKQDLTSTEILNNDCLLHYKVNFRTRMNTMPRIKFNTQQVIKDTRSHIRWHPIH